jgi:hypothetical protein
MSEAGTRIFYACAVIYSAVVFIALLAKTQDRPLPAPKPGETPACTELRRIQSLMYRGMEDQGVVDMPEADFNRYVEPGREFLWDALNRVERLVKACDSGKAGA